MATINLGRIKPVFRGAYAGGTAYVVDDIVTHGNESFICIQAGTGNATSNASYWTKLAAKGADGSDGTDVGTTLTTQGDILYRDGSGLQRLAKGTSGNVLKQGTNHPEWGTAPSGKVLQYVNTHINNRYSCNSNTYGDFSGLPEFSITPTATSSKILLMSTWSLSTSNWNAFKFQTKTGSGSYGDFLLSTGSSGSQLESHFSGAKYNDSDSNTSQSCSCTLLHSPNTTQQVSYKLQAVTHDPSVVYINRTVGDNTGYQETGSRTSNVMLMELEG